MDVLQYILSWILLLFLKFAEATSDDIVILPKSGQDSIKRKLLQIPREFISGIRSLADNSHIPLMTMEYQVQIHSTISEVQLIQEFQNPIFGSYIQAEFYYQTRVTQTFVSLEVYSNDQVLRGIVLDKNKWVEKSIQLYPQEFELQYFYSIFYQFKKNKKSNTDEEEKIIPSPYAEIIEDMHDIMRINLGFMHPGQQVKIVIKYLEELEREADNVWRLTLLTASQLKNNEQKYQSNFKPQFMKNSTNNKQEDQNIPELIFNNNIGDQDQFGNFVNTKCSQYSYENLNFMPYDWKINGQVISNIQIESIVSLSHSQDLKLQNMKMQENENLVYFSLDYGKNTQEVKDFILIITEKKQKNQNQSRAYVGYDPQDTLSPYAALIRFAPLASIKPDENNSSCRNKLKNTQQNTQSQFLKSEHFPSNKSQNEESEDEEEEDDDDEQQQNQKNSQDSDKQQSEDKNKNKKNPSKKDRMILIIIEDILQNTSKDMSIKSYTDYLIESVNELISKLSQNHKQVINIFLVSSSKTLFEKYLEITPANIEKIKEELKIHISQKSDNVALPIKTILSNLYKKVKKQYLILIGTGDYWNINEVLYELGSQKKLIIYALGIGNRLSLQFFQRIEQMNFGKTFILNSISQIKEKIDTIISDLNAPNFKKFTIVYDQKLVSSMTSIIDNIITLSFNKSYSLHVFFNKNFLRLIKHSKKNQIKKISFNLVVMDEENRIYEMKAKIYFDQIFKTNVFHKLSANQQIQSYLTNALYKPQGFSNLSLIRQGTSAYERILQLSIKYQILSELTAMFLLDSQFLICSKSLEQQINTFQPIIIKLVLEESDDEDELSIFQILDTLKKSNKNANDSQQITFAKEDEKAKKKNVKNSPVQQKSQIPEYTCTLNINPLNLNNVLIQKIQHLKVISNQHEIKASAIYHINKNQKGQSYSDLVKILKEATQSIFKVNLESLILTIKSIVILISMLLI